MADLERQLRREIAHERALRRAETKSLRRALELQAAEYERRLKVLNNEGTRIAQIQGASVTAEKFDDYKASQATALELALQRQDDRVKSLEEWRSKAIGVGAAFVVAAGLLGGAITRFFGG